MDTNELNDFFGCDFLPSHNHLLYEGINVRDFGLLGGLGFFQNVTTVLLGNPGVPVTDIHGLEIVPGDDAFVFALQGTGGNAPTSTALLHIERDNGRAINFGGLANQTNP